MLDLEENRRELINIKKRIESIYINLNIDSLKKELDDLEKETLNENFWNNLENSNMILQKIKQSKNKISKFDDIEKKIDTLSELNKLLVIERDESLFDELERETSNLVEKIEKLQIETLLNNKYDKNNAIITFHSGAGGTESQDWVQMLYRMYTKWANKNGYIIKELDSLPGEDVGYKSVTILVEGNNAYGYLKSEHGVHRLVRISPFDANARRHTTFASIEVLPEIFDDTEFEIDPKDLRIDTYRASGAGGQHVNKTDSAIRITHIPTNIVVTCQSERSQRMNKETAMRTLKSKLLIIKEQENKAKIEDIKGIQKEIAWGSQIRSYVFCPYTLVKDHRTGYEMGNIEAVMNGEIDKFIEEFLKSSLK